MLAPLLNLLLPLLMLAGFACLLTGLVFYLLARNEQSDRFKKQSGKLLIIAACCLLPAMAIIMLIKTNLL